MADEEVSKLLYEWDVGEKLLQIFKDNEITIDVLPDLSEQMIKELIPIVGTRAKFIKRFNEWSATQLSPEPVIIDDNPVPDSASNILCSWVLSPSQSNSPGCSYSELATPLSEPTSIAGSPVIVVQNQISNDDQELKVKGFLSSSDEGNALLKSYEEKGRLDFGGRKKLCHLIINKELRGDPDTKVSSERFKQLAYEISKTFPTEHPDTYYIPYSRGVAKEQLLGENSDKFHLGKRNAKGKLLDCMNNKRRELKKHSNKLVFSGEPNRAVIKNPLENISNTVLDDESYEEDLAWLRRCADPWHMVESKWKRTISVRQKELLHSEKSVREYLKEFPALRTTEGHLLLRSDFEHLHPEHTEKLYSNFPLYRDRIFELTKEILESRTKDATIKGILSDYLSFSKGSPETQNCAALLCLPFLIDPTSCGTGKRKKGEKKLPWRPSKAEIRDSFVTHVHSSAQIEETTNRRRDKCAQLSITLQPFVIIVGPDLNNINSAFVVVEDTYYKQDTVLSAIDTCFKLFFVLHAQYPDESAPVWIIIQQGIYKLFTKWDRVYTSVNGVMSDLGMK